MNVRNDHTENLRKHLSAHLQNEISITSFHNISGGCINDCYHIQTTEKEFFLKVNDAATYPGMFAAEVKGLTLLENACPGFTPEVILQYEEANTQYLILAYHTSKRREKNYWQRFANNLALVHQNANNYFGLDHTNYIGALPQINTPTESWIDFFMQHRITHLLSQVIDKGLLEKSITKKFDSLFSKLDSIFPKEKPALLHGDLWGGNHITGNDGFGKIIDPAVYYGHREMDIAMMQLFGGFDTDVFAFYNDIFPLATGWQQRMDICNLYPLLVHVLLFGGSYAQQVRYIVKNFS